MNDLAKNALLSADHAEVDQLLAEALASLRLGDCRSAFEMLDLFWARLAMHIRAEHLHLFPAVLSTIRSGKAEDREGCPSVRSVTAVIGQLRTDHDYFMKELARLIKQMRRLIANENADPSRELAMVANTLEDLSARLRAHNEIEENEIYPLAEIIFGPAQIKTLDSQIKSELENLPPRFIGRANAGV